MTPDEDERLSRALDSLTNRAYTAERRITELEAERLEMRANIEKLNVLEQRQRERAERAEAALADLRELCDEYRANCDPSTTQAQVAEIFRARLEAAVSRG